jgi:hypothetical protein
MDTRIGATVMDLFGAGGIVRSVMRIWFNLNIEGRASGQTQDRLPTLQGFDFRLEYGFQPVVVLKLLFEAELRPEQCLEFPFLQAVP